MSQRDKSLLWQTNVGSHLWSMNRPDSDIDVYEAYQVPTEGILKGIFRDNSHAREETHDGKLWDIQSHEIGVIINQLLKGNMNHIWGVLSPQIISVSNELLRLRDIVEKNLAKNCARSILGMATGNYYKYIVKEKIVGDELIKRTNMICRSLKFGIGIVELHKVSFEPYIGGDVTTIDILIKEMENATLNSTLPERPDENVFREYLLDLREDDFCRDCDR